MARTAIAETTNRVNGLLPTAAKPEGGRQHLAIKAPNMHTLALTIEGTAPLVMHRFGAKAAKQMHDTQAAGGQAKSRKVRTPKDFQALYEDAKHVSKEGWCGIPAPAFRSAMISACRTIGFKMTHAKLGVFVEADGFDRVDGTPLVKITKGEPKYHESMARNDDGGIDLRARPMWDPGWQAVVRIRFDADMFSQADVVNLIARVGLQVGVCEGRPDSKNSAGCGWGTFRVDVE